MKRRPYVNRVSCEHQERAGQGYCDLCWRAALARDFTAEEWAILHAEAGRMPYGWKPRTTPHARPFKPAAAWNGTAVQTIVKAIVDSTEEKDRSRVASYIGAGARGFAIVATDGGRMLATPHASPRAIHGSLADYFNLERCTWGQLPAGVDVSLRRVLLIFEKGHRPIVTVQMAGGEFILSARDPDGDTARESIRPHPAAAPGVGVAVSVAVNGDWLTEALHGPLQLGICEAGQYLMLRPADDSWRYVQMGYRV
jgi:hypothetical protein